jgi:hypothetical protein
LINKEDQRVTQSKKCLFMAFAAIFILSGCGAVNTQLKDIPIEQMDQLQEDFIGRTAWTRMLVVDIGTNGIIDRDVKVEIVSLDLHWNGAVGVRGPNRKIIRHNLGIERPLTKEKFEDALNKAFWFRDPDYRYRMNLRAFGKRTAKAVYNHELYKNMQSEAALYSWGFPDEVNKSDIGGVNLEQWTYKDPRQVNKKRYIWLNDGKVDRWEE